jgi:DNA (cytosine-5)-methyltransferase 1
MGFPDNFIIHDSKSEAYKQVGNSVCVPMVYELAKQVKKQILDNNRKDNNESKRYFAKTSPEQSELLG